MKTTSRHRRMIPARVAVVAAILAATAMLLPAETIRQKEFRPLSPEILGQGGSYAAVAEGYSSLYTNPAGLANTLEPETTLPSLRVWMHSRPDLLLPTIGALGGEDISSDGEEGEEISRDELIIDSLREQFTTNGFGIGSSLGFGYVGNRIGIGMNIATDSYLYGDTFPLGLEGEITSQFTLVFGYAHPFQLGPVDLSLGGALRPNLRVTSLVGSDTAADLITQFTGVDTGEGDGEEGEDLLNSIDALNGWGVAFDAGLLAGYRSFSLGVQARNLFNTNMQYSRNSLDEVFSALSSGGLPAAPEEGDPAYVSERYLIPMELSLGAAWQPDLGQLSALVDPELHVQITDPFGAADIDPDRPNSFWTRVHIGTELTFLRFFDLRFGVNQGYFTLGTGMDLMFLDVQFALFSQEFGRYPGDQQVGGAALEFALRF
ncbi:MAG: hypothetical protein WD492_17960 [Alkalispirochaeta sp.]